MNVQLVVLNPGHFHAALVQKQHLAGVDSHVHVYAPDGSDLQTYLDHIARFNTRLDNPTSWVVDVQPGPDWFERFIAERPGNTVVIAGRNKPKINLILAAVSSGYCVLADKPWIIDAADFPKLNQVFAEADRRGVFVSDIMTERWEITNRLQRELMGNPEVFGSLQPGTLAEPALHMESVHYLSKEVDGSPLRRPSWWFDPSIAGDAIADVGTHLADLAMWLAFPNTAIDHKCDFKLLRSQRWPTCISRDAFREITGLPNVPNELSHLCDRDDLVYAGNGTLLFQFRGKYIRLSTLWAVRSDTTHGDTHFAQARGSRAQIVVRHDSAFGVGPQLFVTPVNQKDRKHVLVALQRHCDERSLRSQDYELNDLAETIHIRIPDRDRTGHEAHFTSVLGEFVNCFHHRDRIPSWERPNLLAKYYVTTLASARDLPN